MVFWLSETLNLRCLGWEMRVGHPWGGINHSMHAPYLFSFPKHLLLAAVGARTLGWMDLPCDCAGVRQHLPCEVSVCPVKGLLRVNMKWSCDSCCSSICLDVENIVYERIGQNPSCTGSLFLTVLWALLGAGLPEGLPWNRQQHALILIVAVD